MKCLYAGLAVALTLSAYPYHAQAQSDELGGQVGEMSLTAEDVELFKGSSYSPYAARHFPT